MKWEEVRNLYPNKFVKLEILESHIVGEKEYVDEVAVIKAISDDKEAMREFIKCKNKQVVYSTKNENFIIDVVRNIGIRRGM
ncbi:hypothetical protein [Romboutsia lituseburensis]|uniref:hypothetical protein n=1 Tax=Romboutsia lituseburensis TaxID=1537 RepID=UPI00215A3563|nr:hypothetical protein [Romboutsia lituseburensis]MCR8744273.1 hypothetical protein [Romboutsia lituseburensis]